MKIKIKKIISFFLVFAMLTSLSLGAFAETNTTASGVEDKEYENMLGLLEALGIIADYDNFSETMPVTRGFFAMVAARLFNTPFEGIADEQHFTDVPDDSSYADAVEMLVSRGIINGDGSGLFRENDRIKTVDALKMLVLVAGYGFIADKNGGYPDGYIKAAYTVGIIDGVGNLYDYVSYESLLTMLSNFLNAKTVNKSYSTTKEEYTLDKHETLLNSVFTTRVVEGVVTKNSCTAFNSVSDLPENYVEITSNSGKYVLYSKTAGEFLGKNVKAYYTKDYTEYGDENVILYAYPTTAKNRIFELNIADVELDRSNKNEIKYYIEGNRKIQKISGVSNPTVIYNKVAYAEGSFNFYNVLNDKKGTIELIDNTGDGVYEIINITAYKSFVIGNVLVDEQKVYSRWDNYGKNTGSNYEVFDINPENFDVFSMKFADGKSAEVLDLIEGHIISIAQNSPSSEKKVIDIIVSKNIQSGKITAIDYDSNLPGKAYIELDSQQRFPVTKDVIDNFDLTLRKETTFYVDALGNVVAAGIIVAGYYRYGLFLDACKDSSGITIQLFTAENTTKEIRLAEKSYIDGTKYTNKKAAWTQLVSLVTEPNVPNQSVTDHGGDVYKLKDGVFIMRYLLNEEGEIYKIDTAAADTSSSEEGGLVLGKSGEYMSLYDYVLIKRMSSQVDTIPFTNDTMVMWVTMDDFEEDEYDKSSVEIYSAADLVSSYDERLVVTYNIKNSNDPENPYADFILVMGSSGISDDASVFVIEKIKMGVDKETDDIVPCVVGYEGGTRKEVLVSPDYAQNFKALNLQPGDTIRCYYDKDDQLRRVATVVSHYSGDSVQIKNPGTAPQNVALSNKHLYLTGYVQERRGELIKVAHNTATTQPLTPVFTGSGITTLYAHPTASTTVTVYNKAENRVFVGTFDDIKDELNHPGEASRVIVRYSSGSLKEIVVYND